MDEEPYSEPTLKVPVPCDNWVLIVVSNGTRYAASEIPRAACSEMVIRGIIAMMDREMANAD